MVCILLALTLQLCNKGRDRKAGATADWQGCVAPVKTLPMVLPMVWSRAVGAVKPTKRHAGVHSR